VKSISYPILSPTFFGVTKHGILVFGVRSVESIIWVAVRSDSHKGDLGALGLRRPVTIVDLTGIATSISPTEMWWSKG